MRTVFNGEPIYALVFAGTCMIVSGLLMLRVEDVNDRKVKA